MLYLEGCFQGGATGTTSHLLHWLHHFYHLSLNHCSLLFSHGVRTIIHTSIWYYAYREAECVPHLVNVCLGRKKLFSSVHYFVHLNLALSLLLGYVVFMFGIELGTSSKVSWLHLENVTRMGPNLLSETLVYFSCLKNVG